MTGSDSDDADPTWPEAGFYLPPPPVHHLDWEPDPIDIAVGKFIREMPLFEVMLMLTRDIVAPSPSWASVMLAGPGRALSIITNGLSAFPRRDHSWLRVYLKEATHVLELRQAIVHGLWTEVDLEPGVFLSERPMLHKPAKEHTGVARLSDAEHPTVRRKFNAAGVMAGRARARSVSHYLDEHQDRWELHFGRVEDL
ncbi:MAG: hypothetical protein WAV00_12155 [Nocardioides sp.]